MFNKAIGNGIIITPYVRFYVGVDTSTTAGANKSVNWIREEDGTITTGKSSPILLEGNYVISGVNLPLVTVINFLSCAVEILENLHTMPLLTILVLEGSLVSKVNIDNNPNLINCNLDGNILSTEEVDYILVTLVEHGKSDGIADLGGSEMGVPSAVGLVAKAILIDRGWVVTTS